MGIDMDPNSLKPQNCFPFSVVITKIFLKNFTWQNATPQVHYSFIQLLCWFYVSWNIPHRSYPPNFLYQKLPYPAEISSPEKTSSGEFSNLRSIVDVEKKASISRAQEHLTVKENESNTLDKWSRYIFLPTFIILNFVYWVYYLVLDENIWQLGETGILKVCLDEIFIGCPKPLNRCVASDFFKLGPKTRLKPAVTNLKLVFLWGWWRVKYWIVINWVFQSYLTVG